MPSTIETKREASRATARRCCTASCIVATVGTRCVSSIKAARVTSAIASITSPSEPVCQFLPADPIDEQAVQWLFDSLSVSHIDIAQRALQEVDAQHEALMSSRRQQLTRLRYQVQLAERQYQQTDPDNRLVAAELEQRWECALRELKAAEDRQAVDERKVAVLGNSRGSYQSVEGCRTAPFRHVATGSVHDPAEEDVTAIHDRQSRGASPGRSQAPGSDSGRVAWRGNDE